MGGESTMAISHRIRLDTVPATVRDLVVRSGLAEADLASIAWYYEQTYDGLVFYRVEVSTVDKRDLIGWVSVDGKTTAVLESRHEQQFIAGV